MDNNILNQAFDSEQFRKTGTELVNLLASTFENAPERAVLPYSTPEEQYHYWKEDFTRTGTPVELLRNVVNRSILYHHPHYMGHQTAVPALPAVLASLAVDFLSNGMGVYEVGMVGNSMERVVCEHLCSKFGMGPNAGGFVTSGGTLGTLTAILTARAHYLQRTTLPDKERHNLCIIASEQAHYCMERAAITMGLSPDGIIKVPVDPHFRMNIHAMKELYEQAVAEGKNVFCIVASAPSTSTGTYDDLESVGKFCIEKGIWFHADGAHGAPAIFSKKHKHLLKGIEYADSVVLDFHKMMLTPGISTALLLKNRAYAFDTFRQEAEYLWEKQDFEWQHGGKSTFECTKSMSILKVYTLFKQFGDQIFEEFVDYTYNLTREFARIIDERPDFEIAHQPDSNILCFRYTACNDPNNFNAELRRHLLNDGRFYIVQTHLNGNTYLRVTLLNPRTTPEHLQNLLCYLSETARNM